MYKKTDEKSITNLLKQLQDQSQDYKNARLELEVSRAGIDKMIGAKIEKQTLAHMCSLSLKDVEDKTWDTLDLSDQRVKEFARYVRNWSPDTPHGLFIYGIPGNAKTHMMKALAIHNCSPSYRFYFVSVSAFMATAKDYVKEYYHANNYVSHLADNYSAVILDDLGTEKTTDFAQEVLFSLMEQLKEKNKRIFMTSNLTIDELKERYKDRIVSRFGEFMIAVENKCPSYRKNIHKDNLKMYEEKVKILPRR